MFGEAFGVVEFGEYACWWEDDGSGDNRASEGPSAGFVDPCDAMESLGCKLFFHPTRRGKQRGLLSGALGHVGLWRLCVGEERRSERRRGGVGRLFLGLTGVQLADTGSFPLEVAEVVEFGAANAATGDDFDFFNHCGMEGKSTLDANAVRMFTNGEGFADTAILFGDADALEKLNAFFFAFTDTDVDAEGVASAKRRDIVA